jgi:hypothetical protein
VPRKKAAEAPRLKAKQRAFLTAFANTGNITQACAAAKTGRRTHYDWLAAEAYAEAFREASDAAADALEREARRRALKGVKRAIYYQGERCGYETVYSDVLLIFLLKALRPDTYRDNVKIEHSGELSVIADRLAAGRKRVAEAG